MSRRPAPAQDEWLAMVLDAKQLADQAAAYRDEVVRKAFEAKVNRDELAAALGITRARLYQIIDGK